MYKIFNTLSLDLLETSLNDFVQHFERAMERSPKEIIHDLPVPSAGLIYDVPIGGLRSEPQVKALPTGTFHFAIERLIENDVSRSYTAIVVQKMAFRLTVQRFRQDRLRLVFEEHFGPFRYAKSLIGWLTPRWGEPVYQLNLEGAPTRRQPPTEIGLTTMEAWVAELTAMGASDQRVAYEFLLTDQELERQRRNIAKKVKEFRQIDRNLTLGELAELLRVLGYGSGTLK